MLPGKEESVGKDTTIAVDLAKSVFEVAVSDRPGRVGERQRLSRSALLPFFAQRPPARILLEACGTAHFWARELERRLLGAAVVLTAALLDRQVANAIGSKSRVAAMLRQKQTLAAVIHLCGAGAGHDFAVRGFRLSPHQRCGDHDVRTYLAKVDDMKRRFARLAAGSKRYVPEHKISGHQSGVKTG